MKSKLVLCAVACLVAAAGPHLQAQEGSRVGVYVQEGLGALGGGTCCGCLAVGGFGMVWGASFLDDDPGGPGTIAWVGGGVALVSALVLPAASGFGAAKAGEGLGEDGSQVWAIVGAYAGTGVGAGLAGVGAWLARRNGYQGNRMSIPFYVVGGLAVPTGAVVGYNLGAPRPTGPFGSRYRERLQLPSVALTSAELPDHSVEYGVKVQLAGLRF